MTSLLGTFSVANTAWESYRYVSLLDGAGDLVTVSFNGSTNTLRLNRPATYTADRNANFLMLVPAFAVNVTQSGNQ